MKFRNRNQNGSNNSGAQSVSNKNNKSPPKSPRSTTTPRRQRHHHNNNNTTISPFRLVSCVVSPSSPLYSSTTPLSRAIAKEQWNQVLFLATEYPEQARRWQREAGLFEDSNGNNGGSRALPLHEALVLTPVSDQQEQQNEGNHYDDEEDDYDLSDNRDDDDDSEEPTNTSFSSTARTSSFFDAIAALVQAYPEALLEEESSYERLPLHCACRKAVSCDILQLLLQSEPRALFVPDALGRLPLHYALSNGARPAVIRLLLQQGHHRSNQNQQCQQANSVDIHGFTPLHVACAAGATPRVIRLLLNAWPGAVWVLSNSGFTVEHCVAQGYAAGSVQRNQVWKMIHDTKLQHPKEEQEEENYNHNNTATARDGVPPPPMTSSPVLPSSSTYHYNNYYYKSSSNIHHHPAADRAVLV